MNCLCSLSTYYIDFTDKVSTSLTNPETEENPMNGHVPREVMGVKEHTPSPIGNDAIKASMESLSASWTYQRDKLVLQNVTFEVNQVSDNYY